MRATAAAIVALLIGLVGCGGDGETKTSPVVAPRVVAQPVKPHRVVERIQAVGDLVAKEEAIVSAEVGGLLTEILLDEGEAVAEGTVILEIDPERRNLELHSHQARVERAEAELRKQERETKRITALGSRNVVSQAQLDAAETELKSAGSDLAEARAQLGLAERAVRDASVSAPFSGWIARRYVSKGELVSVGQKLFDLVALDPIEIEFHLAEVDSARVEIGDDITVRVAPYPDEVFRARVTLISPRVDPETRTLRVKGIIANSNGRLRPGLFARADLGVTDREGVAMIPEEAILQRSDGSVVFRLGGPDHVKRCVIETGVIRDGYVEVVAGLEIGDLVVVRGQAALADGSIVALRQPDGREEPPPVASAEDPIQERE